MTIYTNGTIKCDYCGKFRAVWELEDFEETYYLPEMEHRCMFCGMIETNILLKQEVMKAYI